DLLPRQVRWRTFAPDVRTVTIDRRGRAWYEIEGSASRHDLQRQTELAGTLPAPWIRGASIVRCDSQGRIWLIPHQERTLLLGFDPDRGTWIEHRSGSSAAGAPLALLEVSHESRSGRLYFADRQGIHVLSSGKWSYQPLYDLNQKHGLYHGSTRAFD